MELKRLWWNFISVIHILFDIILHKIFQIAYFGKKSDLPPINNPLLMSSATSLAAKIRKKELKCEDLMNAYISRVEEVNPIINAAVGFRFEKALEEAKKIDELIASNSKTEEEMEKETPFLGIPFSVKESLAVEGMPLTAGLVTRKNCRSSFNAHTVQLMKAAGGIPFVTTNLSELGMWYESYNKVYGRTRNPYDPSRTSGGSSGGEAALIGSGGSVIGIGSDVGGSIRMPALFCGIFGHKPTPNVISNYGTYPSSFEKEWTPFLCMGPLCRYATDLVPMTKVLAGKNAALLHLDKPVKLNELKVYYIEDVGNHVIFTKVEKDMVDAVYKVCSYLGNAYKIIPKKLELRLLKNMHFIWSSIVLGCKATSFSEELTESKGLIKFVIEFLRWTMGNSCFTLPIIGLCLLENILSKEKDYYGIILQDLKQELQDILGNDGILLFPSHPTCAPHHNETLFKLLNFTYTGIFNVLGFPVTQVPMGLGKEKLPLGVQVVATPLNDRITLAVAVELEKAFGGWVSPSPVKE